MWAFGMSFLLDNSGMKPWTRFQPRKQNNWCIQMMHTDDACRWCIQMMHTDDAYSTIVIDAYSTIVIDAYSTKVIDAYRWCIQYYSNCTQQHFWQSSSNIWHIHAPWLTFIMDGSLLKAAALRLQVTQHMCCATCKKQVRKGQLFKRYFVWSVLVIEDTLTGKEKQN